MPILTIRTFRVEGPETPFCPVACNYKKHYNKVLDGMKYEWDEAKNRKNVAKHGLSFEDAEQVFVGSCVTLKTIVLRMAKNGLSLWACWPGVWLS
jgi:hypothetical protein